MLASFLSRQIYEIITSSIVIHFEINSLNSFSEFAFGLVNVKLLASMRPIELKMTALYRDLLASPLGISMLLVEMRNYNLHYQSTQQTFIFSSKKRAEVSL